MKVVVAGRVSVGVDAVLAGCDCAVDCPLDELVVVDDVVVDCAAALDATASVSAAANTPRFHIRTSASKLTLPDLRIRRRPLTRRQTRSRPSTEPAALRADRGHRG
jgi:hypothetical protein